MTTPQHATASGRPRLAVHYSPALDDLWPRWQDRVDYVKVGPWTGEAVLDRYRGRCLLHGIADGFILSARGLPAEAFWRELRRLAALTGTPWLSDHIGFAYADVRVRFRDGNVEMDAEDPLDPAEAVGLMIRAIDAIEGHTDLPFLGENLDYVDLPAYRHITEPDFICEVLRLSGCDLLLDTAHARVAAGWLGMPVESYLDALPLERAREIHYNGPRVRGGRLWDAHATAAVDDENLLVHVLGRCAPEVVTLEYRGDDLEREIERLLSTISRAS